jgi:hypothetical protein
VEDRRPQWSRSTPENKSQHPAFSNEKAGHQETKLNAASCRFPNLCLRNIMGSREASWEAAKYHGQIRLSIHVLKFVC